jgi:hypothetical protein
MGHLNNAQTENRISNRLATKQATRSLPPELWAMIFAFLSASELCAAKSVCRHWRSLVSTTPFRAVCTFYDFDPRRNERKFDHLTIENKAIRVRIELNDTTPANFEYFVVPGLIPLMQIKVEPLSCEWNIFPLNFPLIATVRQLVSERCGLNISLILSPSTPMPSRFLVRCGIPMCADFSNGSLIIYSHLASDSPVYLSTVTMLKFDLDDDVHFKFFLDLMPSVTIAIVEIFPLLEDDGGNEVIPRNDFECGLDSLPNLTDLVIFTGMKSRSLSRNEMTGIAKLGRLERLMMEGRCDEANLDGLCDMFAALGRLRSLRVAYSHPTSWINFIRTSEKLRRAMQHITHIGVIEVKNFETINSVADIIDTLARLDTVNRITIHMIWHDGDDKDAVTACVAAAYNKARELRSARLHIEIFEKSYRRYFPPK